ncbi:MAG: PH domain-containing protein [Ktedonobacteraceae bacterium]
MSSKVKAKNSPVIETPHDERWRSGRNRFGGLRFRRGRDQKWHFAGQQPDETVTLVVHKHKWFLFVPALPFIGSFALLFIEIGASTRLSNPFWPFLEIATVVLILLTLGWFLWKDFIVWYLETYIITNKRIINSRGLLEPTRQTTPLENVKQVGIELDNFLGFWLRFGTVHVYLTGGDLIMKEVPNPKRIKEAIDGIKEAIEAKKPKEEKLPVPANSAVATIIDELSKGKEPPKLEDADEKYKLRNPDGRIGPRRTFGGFLHIPCEVHYTSGETTVRYIQRSTYVLIRQLILPVLALLIALPLTVYMPFTAISVVNAHAPLWYGIMTVVILGLLLYIGFTYTNYVDDVYILTNKRIIDIERRYIFFYEMRIEVDYKNIRDIKVKVPNVLQRLLDIGNVTIEVAGSPGMVLPTVDHPFFLQDKIYEIQKNKEKAGEVKKFNDEKKELKKWFSKVVTTLVETTQVKGAPNLQNLDWLEAMERASELGFNVVVCGEDASSPDTPPGQVIHQSPPPGTVISQDGEIQVILSRKPTSAEMTYFR